MPPIPSLPLDIALKQHNMRCGILCDILIQKQRHYSVILNPVSAKWGRKVGRLYQCGYQGKGQSKYVYTNVTLLNYSLARSKF